MGISKHIYNMRSEVANLLRTCYGKTMGKLVFWGKLATGKLLANLLQNCCLCCGLVSDTMGKSPTCYGVATEKLV